MLQQRAQLTKKYRIVLLALCVASVSIIVLATTWLNIANQDSNITDEARMSDLLLVEDALGQFSDTQTTDHDDRVMPKNLSELSIKGLQGDIKDYSYSNQAVHHFGFTYIICTKFKMEAKKFSDKGYPSLSGEQAQSLFTQLTQPYSPHHKGKSCFKVSTGVKGTQRELIGDTKTYEL